MRRTVTLVFTFIVGLTAARADDPVTYAKDIQPIFRKHCLTCHNAERPRGDLDLSTFSAVMIGGTSGKAAVAGKPDASPLYTQTAHLEDPKMPPNKPKIPQREVDLIKKWIEGGLKEKADSAVAVAPPKVEPKSATSGLVAISPLPRPNAIAALAVSPAASIVAVSGKKQVLIYDLSAGKWLGALPFEGDVHALRFSADGLLLLAGGGVGGQSGKVIGYSTSTWQRVFEVGDDTDIVLTCDISADKSKVVIGGPSRVVKIFAVADGKALHSLRKPTDWVTAVSFSPDGLLVGAGDRFGALFLWETKSGKEFAILRGHTRAITGIAWRADGDVLASASEDGSVRLWNMHEAKEVAQWEAHPQGVLALDFHRNGTIATAGRDRHVRLWDSTGKLKANLGTTADIALKIGFTSDAGRLVSGDWSGEISVWSAEGKQENLVSLPLTKERPVRPSLVAPPELIALQARQTELAAEAAKAIEASRAATAELESAQKGLADAKTVVSSTEAALAKAKEVVTALTPIVEARSQAARAAVDRAAKTEAAAKQIADELESLKQSLTQTPAQLQARIDKAQRELDAIQLALSEKKALAKLAAETAARLKTSDPTSKTLGQAEDLARSLADEIKAAEAVVERCSNELRLAKSAAELAGKSLNTARP